jgi:predicted N-acetyltransferase YhbS
MLKFTNTPAIKDTSMETFDIRPPRTESEKESILELLQTTMREPPHLYPIAQEYPVVLGPNMMQYSLCAFHNHQPVAHLSLWPRTLTDEHGRKQMNVALVGNVATHQTWRRQGLSRSILMQAEETAKHEGIQLLILWSDLQEYYQNLGFTSMSCELRVSVPRSRTSSRLKVVREPWNLDAAKLEGLMKLRPLTPYTLGRSAKEFQLLLRIPDLVMLVGPSLTQPDRYYLIGKGADMAGVVHEWGTSDLTAVSEDIGSIADALDVSELLFLAPPTCRNHFESKNIMQIEEWPVALSKWLLPPTDKLRSISNQIYIFGLDSI